MHSKPFYGSWIWPAGIPPCSLRFPYRSIPAQSVLAELKDLAVSSSGKNNLEINSIHAQKGVALEKVLSSKGLNVKDAMAIGDNLNDLSMMKVVGRPVAMGNGLPEVKEFCSHVTAT